MPIPHNGRLELPVAEQELATDAEIRIRAMLLIMKQPRPLRSKSAWSPAGNRNVARLLPQGTECGRAWGENVGALRGLLQPIKAIRDIRPGCVGEPPSLWSVEQRDQRVPLN